MIFELEWHIGLSVFPSKPAHHILSQSQYAGARPSLLFTAACSTLKMTSFFGKEVQEEHRRNSLSKKRKFSPGTEEEKNQKTKPNTPQTEKDLARR